MAVEEKDLTSVVSRKMLRAVDCLEVPMKLESLTPEQQVALAAYRQKAFDRAICTDSADRPRAEAAARRMAEIAGVKVTEILWVANPQDGKVAYDAVTASGTASGTADGWRFTDSGGTSWASSTRPRRRRS